MFLNSAKNVVFASAKTLYEDIILYDQYIAQTLQKAIMTWGGYQQNALIQQTSGFLE